LQKNLNNKHTLNNINIPFHFLNNGKEWLKRERKKKLIHMYSTYYIQTSRKHIYFKKYVDCVVVPL